PTLTPPPHTRELTDESLLCLIHDPIPPQRSPCGGSVWRSGAAGREEGIALTIYRQKAEPIPGRETRSGAPNLPHKAKTDVPARGSRPSTPTQRPRRHQNAGPFSLEADGLSRRVAPHPACRSAS